MERNKFAVAAGTDFGLIPAHELGGILMDQTDIAVRIENRNWNLYQPQAPADIQRVDSLLTKYGRYPLEDHRIEPVIMYGELELAVPNFDWDRDSLMFGGYCFVCDGKEIPVDFSGTAWNIIQDDDKLFVPFTTGRTGLATDYFLDDCYIDDYAKAGYRIQDITAEFLSRATSINEFVVSLEFAGIEYLPEEIAQNGRFEIKSLCFGNGIEEHPVKQNVLDAFNEKINKKKSLTEQLQSAQSRIPTDIAGTTAREHDSRS